jgi:hypothetical protein
MLYKNKADKKAVKLYHDGYGLQLCTMRNGYQWTCAPVDKELLLMIKDAIRFFEDCNTEAQNDRA